MIAEERETTVTYTDADDVARLYTCRRQDITALSKRIQPIEEGAYADGTRWARFEIPLDRFKLAIAIRSKREMTEERRAALRERASAERAARGR